MKFNEKELLHLADLAKLKLSGQEIKTYNEQLQDILTYAEKINKLDLDTVKESLTGAEDIDLGPRPDKVIASNPTMIKQSCNLNGDYISVPNVFEK